MGKCLSCLLGGDSTLEKGTDAFLDKGDMLPKPRRWPSPSALTRLQLVAIVVVVVRMRVIRWVSWTKTLSVQEVQVALAASYVIEDSDEDLDSLVVRR